MKRICKTADEEDAHSRWRRVLIWRAGDVKKIKRRTNRRERREAKGEIREQLED